MTMIVMSALPPKAEVTVHEVDVRYVPSPEVGMPVEEPSTASKADNLLLKSSRTGPIVPDFVGQRLSTLSTST